jgi:hypothetical protein
MPSVEHVVLKGAVVPSFPGDVESEPLTEVER